jgi:hypothetical protein
MNIAPNAAAIIDGNPVDEDTVIQEGQSLMFIAPSGEKGRREERRTRSERQES